MVKRTEDARGVHNQKRRAMTGGIRRAREGRVGRDEISSKKKKASSTEVQKYWCSQTRSSQVLVVSGVIQVWITTGDQKLSGHQIHGPCFETGALKRECV